MKLTQLRIQHLRRIDSADMAFAPGLNVFLGANGAGKTTVLEATHLLASGRSFRAGAREALQARGHSEWLVFGQTRSESGMNHRLALSRSGASQRIRIDDRDGTTLSELASLLAVICFEPGSHEIISGGSEPRRSLIDWGVFHVEPQFLPAWRRYTRALKQRNALLKSNGSAAELEPWELEMSRSGEILGDIRKRYIHLLRPHLVQTTSELLVELGEARLDWDSGWADAQVELGAELGAKRDYDRMRGFTTRGPHRADWTLRFEAAPGRDYFSRGQEKLAILSVLLAQARLYRDLKGHWPVILLDDLASELDYAHQDRLLSELLDTGAQLLVTGTEASTPMTARLDQAKVFHVEQGSVRF